MVEIDNLTKVYKRGAEQIHALKGIKLKVDKGDFICLLGPSGAGKTTLLNIIGCMDTPTSGGLRIAGRNIVTDGKPEIRGGALDSFRRRHIGFIFTDFFLIPTLSAMENVEMPLLWSGKKTKNKAKELLETVGLSHRLTHHPHELSGGEMQRVAIARALVNDPNILLADEPTGNLDTKTRDTILDLFKKLNENGLTIILATHDHDIAERVKKVIRIDEGRLAG